MVKPGKLFIGGEWVDAHSGKTYDDINPATSTITTKIAEAGKEDVDAAVQAARRAQETGPWWNKMFAADRGKLIWKIGDLISKYNDELAELETLDTGKPISETKKIDVPMSADIFHYYAGAASKMEGETVPVKGNFLNYTLREPLGVVGLIVPWNFPLLILARKMAAALAAGNCIVAKPSEETPLTALRLGEICQEAGLPPGVLNIITGYGKVAGASIVSHPDVDGISFTGSTEVGQELMRNGSVNVKKLSLELGGKSPNIIFADADLETAVKYAIAGIFYNAGEVCTAGSRLLVEDSVKDQFMEKLIERGKKMVYGDPMDPKTRLGPLISSRHRENVERYVEAGKQEGAKVLIGGAPGEGKGFYYQPTIFDGVEPKMTIAREEIFGPVLATLKFKTFEEAVELGNNSMYGLACGIWTSNIKKAHKLAQKIKAGSVWINTYNMYDAAMPYGGYKMSGFGTDSGLKTLDFYTRMKSVWVDLNE